MHIKGFALFERRVFRQKYTSYAEILLDNFPTSNALETLAKISSKRHTLNL